VGLGMSAELDRSEPTGRNDEASNEIARSLGAVWHRFSGHRPKTMSVEVTKDAVRCEIDEGPPEAAVEGDAEAVDGPGVGSRRFDYDVTAAVARVTGQRVIAFIPKRDKKTQIVKQTYILDRPRQRF
jgi:hypothetical protein